MNKPNYKNSITNLSNSILKHFEIEPFHSTIPEIDAFLLNKKKVLVFLFDGMGKYILEKHLPNDSFLRKNVIHTITSTFPPTTVAATNSFLSAKYPNETGWISWTQYFKEVDKNVCMFSNRDDETGERIPGPSLANTYCNYESIIKLINQKKGQEIAFLNQGTDVDTTHYWNRHLKAFIAHNYKQCNSLDESFIYAYWIYPDHLMHEKGTTDKGVHKIIKDINKYVERYSKKYEDVTTLVIADHGLIDVTNLDMWKEQDLLACLKRNVTFEKRAANFFVKEDKKEEFVRLFKEKYGKHYELYTKEEIYKMKLYGDITPNENVDRFFGDYIAIATDNFMLKDSENGHNHKAHHAGSTLDELMIDVIGIK